ncbi:hypothetical protein K0M31_014699 [Melipona bicolor]|uniref:Uncharacterized protein n=1 Tax=Melipona bicolor TaxID=60889 RepID=A0AA40KFZ2_9HYME|nr:hypothetical protein K0M31_014699 [Melipona bicolor]
MFSKIRNQQRPPERAVRKVKTKTNRASSILFVREDGRSSVLSVSSVFCRRVNHVLRRQEEETGRGTSWRNRVTGLMTRAWPLSTIAYCALESVTTQTNATIFVLSACLSVAKQAWTRRKMGGKVGLICGSCWSGKYSMLLIN